MNILAELNLEYQIKEENNVFYDMQEKQDTIIIARNKAELIQFYIESYKYKINCLFDGETETRKNYGSIIDELENLIENN